MAISAEPGGQIEISGEPTAVYRFYDRDCVLLYVGISNNLGHRWGQHAAEKTWWPLVATRTVVMCGSRAEAEEAEKTAIRTEKPAYNVVGRNAPKPKHIPKPRRPALKTPSDFEKRLKAMQRAQSLRESFTFHESFLDKIDAYATANEHDRYTALCILLATGIHKVEEEEAEHNAKLAAIRAEIAALEAQFGPASPVGAGA